MEGIADWLLDRWEEWIFGFLHMLEVWQHGVKICALNTA